MKKRFYIDRCRLAARNRDGDMPNTLGPQEMAARRVEREADAPTLAERVRAALARLVGR